MPKSTTIKLRALPPIGTPDIERAVELMIPLFESYINANPYSHSLKGTHDHAEGATQNYCSQQA